MFGWFGHLHGATGSVQRRMNVAASDDYTASIWDAVTAYRTTAQGVSGQTELCGDPRTLHSTHGIDEFARPFPKPLGVAFTAFRQRQIGQSRVLAREAPSGLAVSAQVDRWMFFAHGFARSGTAACARTGRAGMVEGGPTNGVASSNARCGRRSLATRPVQPV